MRPRSTRTYMIIIELIGFSKKLWIFFKLFFFSFSELLLLFLWIIVGCQGHYIISHNVNFLNLSLYIFHYRSVNDWYFLFRISKLFTICLNVLDFGHQNTIPQFSTHSTKFSTKTVLCTVFGTQCAHGQSWYDMHFVIENFKRIIRHKIENWKLNLSYFFMPLFINGHVFSSASFSINSTNYKTSLKF